MIELCRAASGTSGEIFDRDREWRGHSLRFTADPAPGATLGIVDGRRCQGKTYLLGCRGQCRTGSSTPTEATETESLGSSGARWPHGPAARTRSRAGRSPGPAVPCGRLQPIVIDESPTWSKPARRFRLWLKRALDPAGIARRSRSRLLLCGSAMAVMGGLLAGAPAARPGRAGGGIRRSATGTPPGSGESPSGG